MRRYLNIGKFNISARPFRVFIIAEIGANHEGNFALAKRLIIEAKKAGADAVKFQTYTPEKIVAVTEVARRKHFSKMALSEEQFKKLSEHAAEVGVMFMSTPFDEQSVDFLDSIGVPAFKVASGDFTCFPLLKRIVQKNKPIILSTGLSTMAEMHDAYRYLLKVNPEIKHKLAFLHCVTSYPTDQTQANLGMVRRMQDEFKDVVIGYSDHSLDLIDCYIAVAWGALIIEKHFTIDNNYSNFRDHKLSANPTDFKTLVDTIRAIEKYMESSKDTSESEESNFIPFRRSLAAKTDLKIGNALSEDNMTYLRPQIGIPANQYDQYIGYRVVKPLIAGEIITTAHVKKP